MKRTLFWDPPSDMKRPAESLQAFINASEFNLTTAANAMGVSRGTLSRVLRGRGFDADMALRIGAFTGTGPSVWIYSQAFWQLHDAYHGKSTPADKRIRTYIPATLSAMQDLRDQCRREGKASEVARKLWPFGPPDVFTPKVRGVKEVQHEA